MLLNTYILEKVLHRYNETLKLIKNLHLTFQDIHMRLLSEIMINGTSEINDQSYLQESELLPIPFFIDYGNVLKHMNFHVSSLVLIYTKFHP